MLQKNKLEFTGRFTFSSKDKFLRSVACLEKTGWLTVEPDCDTELLDFNGNISAYDAIDFTQLTIKIPLDDYDEKTVFDCLSELNLLAETQDYSYSSVPLVAFACCINSTVVDYNHSTMDDAVCWALNGKQSYRDVVSMSQAGYAFNYPKNNYEKCLGKVLSKLRKIYRDELRKKLNCPTP